MGDIVAGLEDMLSWLPDIAGAGRTLSLFWVMHCHTPNAFGMRKECKLLQSNSHTRTTKEAEEMIEK